MNQVAPLTPVVKLVATGGKSRPINGLEHEIASTNDNVASTTKSRPSASGPSSNGCDQNHDVPMIFACSGSTSSQLCQNILADEDAERNKHRLCPSDDSADSADEMCSIAEGSSFNEHFTANAANCFGINTVQEQSSSCDQLTNESKPNTVDTTDDPTAINESEAVKSAKDGDTSDLCNNVSDRAPIEVRLLVRRREAGALIGKRGLNIKRLRDMFKQSTFSIPDTGNGPERVVCIKTNTKEALDTILQDMCQLFLEKSQDSDEQIELKLLIHSSQAGSLIGVAGQSIKKLRNDTKAAIKIYELCCPLSSERVCAIKAKPAIVVETIKVIRTILVQNPIKGIFKPYDALNYDISLIDKYGGFLPDIHQQQQSLACDLLIQNQFLPSPNSHHHHHHHLQNQARLDCSPSNHLYVPQLQQSHQQYLQSGQYPLVLNQPHHLIQNTGTPFSSNGLYESIRGSSVQALGRQKHYNNATVWTSNSLRPSRPSTNGISRLMNDHIDDIGLKFHAPRLRFPASLSDSISNNQTRFQRFQPYHTPSLSTGNDLIDYMQTPSPRLNGRLQLNALSNHYFMTNQINQQHLQQAIHNQLVQMKPNPNVTSSASAAANALQAIALHGLDKIHTGSTIQSMNTMVSTSQPQSYNLPRLSRIEPSCACIQPASNTYSGQVSTSGRNLNSKYDTIPPENNGTSTKYKQHKQ